MLETGVHVIDDNDDLDRRLASAEGLERGDGLRNIIIQDSEVLLLKAAYRLP